MMIEEEFQQRDHEQEAHLPIAAGTGGLPAEAGRYDFPLPTETAISDLLGVQLAECVRVVRNLSDRVIGEPLEIYERSQTIHSLGDVITASGNLAECLDRMHGGSGWQDAPRHTR